MSLAALVKARHKAGYVIPEIDEHCLMLDDSDRRDGKFHPSDLCGRFCPRAWSLFNYHPDGLTVHMGRVDSRLARIFGNGHHVHARIQTYLANRGILWGNYREYGTGSLYTGFQRDSRDQFLEVPIRHDGDRIIGHTDGLLNLRQGKIGLEIKSINTEGFRWLNDLPREYHRDQTYIYMHSLVDEFNEQALQGTQRHPFEREPLAGFIILYENKDTQELKEFFVKYDATVVADYMKGRRKLIWQALEYERTKEHPQCRCLSGKESALCKKFPE